MSKQTSFNKKKRKYNYGSKLVVIPHSCIHTHTHTETVHIDCYFWTGGIKNWVNIRLDCSKFWKADSKVCERDTDGWTRNGCWDGNVLTRNCRAIRRLTTPMSGTRTPLGIRWPKSCWIASPWCQSSRRCPTSESIWNGLHVDRSPQITMPSSLRNSCECSDKKVNRAFLNM